MIGEAGTKNTDVLEPKLMLRHGIEGHMGLATATFTAHYVSSPASRFSAALIARRLFGLRAARQTLEGFGPGGGPGAARGASTGS